jgi:hypothetical protein
MRDLAREQQVLCLSTANSAGCFHPVAWHVGPGTPVPDCACCSWRKNAPQHVRAEDKPTPVFSGKNRATRRAEMKRARRAR